jgi:cyclophilin family peptidyl-prolyl cis-trans isomerase
MKTFKTLVTAVTTSLLLALGAAATQAANPKVVLKTNLGDVTLELYRDSAPHTVDNFLAYVDSGFYDGTIFHRTIPGFMVQGGGFKQDMQQKTKSDSDPTDPIVNEANNRLHNERGTIAMARGDDPNSATSQFFINLKMNMSLDWSESNPGYAVFGKVTDGMDVVDAMVLQPTGRVGRRHEDVPVDPIIIKKASRKTANP